MPAVTIRNLSEETHRGLKARAARNNRSTEAEIRAILDAAAVPPDRVGLGTLLNEIARKHGVTNEDVEELEKNMRRPPAEPLRFE